MCIRDSPYLTLRPEFEARQVEIFGEMAKKGYIYKGMKAVYSVSYTHLDVYKRQTLSRKTPHDLERGTPWQNFAYWISILLN